ncbi:MAG: hypothetical protein GX557_15600 [Chloroflexi bacterium]|nr:hypothetical protein [Chloroflexota bacterium]
MHGDRSLWCARAAIAVVFAWNIECAVAFIAWPERYVAGFELAGLPGATPVRAMGILFAMWNVPYTVALWHPRRHRTSLIEALVMQSIGLVGETALWLTLPTGHALLRSSAWRFMLFDGAGVALLALAVWLASRVARPREPSRLA